MITAGVTPSLHVDDKPARLKPYHKEGRALHTETTSNDPRDFGIGKRRTNLPALRAVGFAANRRLLDVQYVSHDCTIGEDALRQVTPPVTLDGQRAAGLRFADPRVQALLSVLVLCCLLPQGFSNALVRERPALLLGLAPGAMTPGRMSYDLRRLRLHGLIERLPHTHRYRLTADGLRIALFYTRTYAASSAPAWPPSCRPWRLDRARSVPPSTMSSAPWTSGMPPPKWRPGNSTQLPRLSWTKPSSAVRRWRRRRRAWLG